MLIKVVKGVNAVPRILSDPSFEMYRPYLAWDLDSGFGDHEDDRWTL